MAGVEATPDVTAAESIADYEAFGRICRAYVDWCRQRYEDMPWFFDEVFGYQSLDDELTILATKYGPPNGRVFIARAADDVVAGGAFWRLSPRVCEMKRVFVADRARGLGLGRKLCNALVAAARTDGFDVMRLDTADRLTEALAMYESLGFIRIQPYRDYPARLTPHLIFMEATL